MTEVNNSQTGPEPAVPAGGNMAEAALAVNNAQGVLDKAETERQERMIEMAKKTQEVLKGVIKSP